MDEAGVRERVRVVILEMAPLRPAAIEGVSKLRGELGYDSLSLLELAGELEREFTLPAGDEDESGVETVADVEGLVLAKLGATRQVSG